VEVRRHLIEQNQDGIVALEEPEPVLFVRRLGTARPERFELISLVKLAGDLPQKKDGGLFRPLKAAMLALVKANAFGMAAQYLFRKSGCLASRPNPTRRWVFPPPMACLR
jgi:hypothetical protein